MPKHIVISVKKRNRIGSHPSISSSSKLREPPVSHWASVIKPLWPSDSSSEWNPDACCLLLQALLFLLWLWLQFDVETDFHARFHKKSHYSENSWLFRDRESPGKRLRLCHAQQHSIKHPIFSKGPSQDSLSVSPLPHATSQASGTTRARDLLLSSWEHLLPSHLPQASFRCSSESRQSLLEGRMRRQVSLLL